jgi:hypothetical protein
MQQLGWEIESCDRRITELHERLDGLMEKTAAT